MAHRVIKYLKHASYSAVDWTTRNPFLLLGEIGFETTAGVVKRHKVGPGYWNDLPYEETIYGYQGVVTSPIGDASGDLYGLSVSEILYRMLNAYQVPVFSSASNNGGPGSVNIQTREIGSSLAGPVTVTYGVNNQANLVGGNCINVSAGGAFSNEGSFPHTGSFLLSLPAPLNPALTTTIVISITGTHQQGITAPITTQIRFWPRLMWVSSALSSMPDGATFMAQVNRQSILANDFRRDYAFTGANYRWIAVPEMLAPSGLYYADVTNPNAPLPIDMSDMGALSINNGVATYSYRMLRSTYSHINPVTIRVAV